MGKRKLLKLILQELNSVNSKLYRMQNSEPKIAVKQRVAETPFAKSVLAAMDILADGIEIKPQVGMLQSLENSQGSDFTNSLLQQPTEAKNKAEVLAMREEWEAKKEEQIKEGSNEKEVLKEQFYEKKSAEGLWEGPDRPKQPTEDENKTQVLAMREEWEARKEAKISEAKNEREATNERITCRSVFYNHNGH